MNSSTLKLAGMNAVWVLLLTLNSRIVNMHPLPNLGLVVLSQMLVAAGFFTILKAIQIANTFTDKIAYMAGGGIGACGGVLLTSWIR